MIEISQSELSTWARCPRKWLVNYYYGAVPAEDEITGNRILGTRVHTALQARYDTGANPVDVLAILYQMVLDAHPEASQDILKERELAQIMTSGYLEWLEGEGADAHLQQVAAEADVKVPLPGLPGVMLRARLDAVFRDIQDGHYLFRDYKTADSFQRHELLALDWQMRFYCLVTAILRNQGEDFPVVRGGMVDTLRRVKRSSKSQPPYYRRDYFRYGVPELEATARRAGKLATEILHVRDLLDAAAARGDDLAAVNILQQAELRPVPILTDCSWSCPLAGGICTMMDDGSDWPGALFGSGKFRQGDPYAYYRADPLAAVRAQLASA